MTKNQKSKLPYVDELKSRHWLLEMAYVAKPEFFIRAPEDFKIRSGRKVLVGKKDDYLKIHDDGSVTLLPRDEYRLKYAPAPHGAEIVNKEEDGPPIPIEAVVGLHLDNVAQANVLAEGVKKSMQEAEEEEIGNMNVN